MFDRTKRLKKKARRLYLDALAIGDTMDCGHAMALEISRIYSQTCREFNEVWAELRKLDPTCPPAPDWIRA